MEYQLKSTIKKLWFEAYRPKTLEDGYIFQSDQQQQQLTRILKSGEIPHLLLSGVQGTGKTTIAEILIAAAGIDEADILRINASDNNGIDFIRDVILSFAGTFPVGKFKVIKLEEADYISLAAQGMLRAVFEENADTCRFIMTCNLEHRIIPALKSRVQHYHFKSPSKDKILERMFEILVLESVEFDPEIVDKYVTAAYPDIRKIINHLQANTIDNVLIDGGSTGNDEDYLLLVLESITAGKLEQMIPTVIDQCYTDEHFKSVYEFISNNIHLHPKIKASKDILRFVNIKLADIVYKHGICISPQLSFKGGIASLCELLEEK